MNQPDNQCKTRTLKLVELSGAVITLIMIAALVYSIINMNFLEDKVNQNINAYGISGLLIISFILDLIPQFFSPFVALTTGILAGINIHIAILSVIIGSTVGSLIGFFLGKKYMFSLVDCLVKQNQEKRFTFLINKYGVL